MTEEHGSPPHPELTRFLFALGRGEPGAAAELMPELMEELALIARAHMRSQRADHTLQPTALVNEVWLKLLGSGETSWNDRAQFFATAARAMRQVLVDHERARRRDKRGGGERPVSLHTGFVDAERPSGLDVLDFDAALTELEALDERHARVVDLRYFGGLEVEEVAEVLGVSKTTVERDWRAARAWLWRRLKSGSP